MVELDFDLSDFDGFWTSPEDNRQRAFAELRALDQPAFFEEREIEAANIPAGPGYWAIVRYADIVEVSRHPELFCSGQGIRITDLPPEMMEFFGSMIAMDDPRQPDCASSCRPASPPHAGEGRGRRPSSRS